ncbi:MAG: hypothetical protein KA120_03545 [Candidatus Goldbacteria bacterium]|nr:hypothetical protein [Candidatus Goldiibacteriota bacterium]
MQEAIEIVGFLTFISLLITFILGFFKINVKNRFVMHKVFGIITITLGITHVLLNILS